MLLNYDPKKPLYIVGTSISSYELKQWVDLEVKNKNTVVLVDRAEYKKLPSESQCMIGFSNIEYRKSLLSEPEFLNRQWVGYVHHQSVVDNTSKVGIGTIIYPLVFLGLNTNIGDFCWITACSHVGHNSKLSKNVIVNPGTTIAGSTVIGDNVQIGQCGSIKDKLIISSNVELLMNSVVTKDISEPGKYYGNKKVFF